MTVLAIGKVINSDDVAEEKGWKTGYRLIDTIDYHTLDLSDEAMRVACGRGYMLGNGRTKFMDGYCEYHIDCGGTKDEVLDLPTIYVEANGKERVDTGGIPMYFVLNQYVAESCGDIQTELCTIYNVETKDTMLVRDYELTEEVFTIGKIALMNYCWNPNKEIYQYVGVQEDEKAVKWFTVGNKQARDYIMRTRTLGICDMYFCDRLKRDGVQLAGLRYDLKLDTFEMPEYVTDIGEDVFLERDLLKRIVFSSHIGRVSEAAFTGTMCEEIVLNEGLGSLDDNAFNGAAIEKPLVIPSTVALIAESALDNIYCREIIVKSNHLATHRTGMHWFTTICEGVEKITLSEDAAVKLIEYHTRKPSSFTEAKPESGIKRTGNKLKIPRDKAVQILTDIANINRKSSRIEVAIAD